MSIDTSSTGGASELEWFKSSYSTNDGPDCVEIAAATGTVHVRDSKNADGARLAFTAGSWSAFATYAASAK
ncbi:DUF397 domain-containing protein [Streptomyces sp. NBC_01465]|uniref:DUF397 domain-containing protein n=1 Tax=Streptomyces sp. NBC_01465 TaxID=2903878 RepID=UPI002E30B4C4|nr:DUF397 domain-containing protein [Streptomyces sp. NBC_01465]